MSEFNLVLACVVSAIGIWAYHHELPYTSGVQAVLVLYFVGRALQYHWLAEERK